MKFIIFLLLLSGSAWADVSAEKVSTIVGCEPNENNALIEMDRQIGNRLQDLLAGWGGRDLDHVRSDFIIPENRVYSENSPVNDQYIAYWEKMKMQFTKMNQATLGGIHFECRDMYQDRQCNQGQVFAYVRFMGNQALPKIYICSGFFALPQELQLSTVFHELSHYAANTQDYAMDWWSKDSIDVLRAADDAYHIQNFAMGDEALVLKRNIWFWLWPKATTTAVDSMSAH